MSGETATVNNWTHLSMCIKCSLAIPVEFWDNGLMKICSSCNVAEAKHTYCKPCKSIRNAAYHKAHPEKSRQTSKKYDKENRDKRRVHEEKYKKSNPDKVREWKRRNNITAKNAADNTNAYIKALALQGSQEIFKKAILTFSHQIEK